MSHFLPFEFANWATRLLLAQGVIIGFLLLNVVSSSMPHAGDFKPFFLLMAVYYWTIYRPSLMPVIYTFALGLVIDLLASPLVGLTSLILIGLQMLVLRSRLFLMGQPYMMVWLGFGVVALAYGFSFWLMMSLFSFSIAPMVPMLIAAFLSTLLFPLASVILLAIHRILPVA